ncbi:MAG: Flp pilus assembly protein CpaB [Sphingomonadales bacterium]|nr:Flp pilus assembly protein CpaB [Sphingomonadales bacterium]MDE2568017.1 Flp pilus assembly protein CpaB [Sphingomonadales bacterium]
MNGRTLAALAVAVVVGLIAVYFANIYFSGIQTRQEQAAVEQKLARIVVANQSLAFGDPITTQNVHFANWPADSVPQGAFTSLEDATKSRVALRPIVPGEPVLASKVSGADGRATLSANLPNGKVAYTIPISAVTGVGGFVRPGDIVDVLLTRSIQSGVGEAAKISSVILQSVPVLGIDQVADDNATKPAVGKTATLELFPQDAQKLAVAMEMGSISLALRNVADQQPGFQRPVVSRELGGASLGMVQRAAAPVRRASSRIPNAPAMTPSFHAGPSMTVIRGVNPTVYEVRRGY